MVGSGTAAPGAAERQAQWSVAVAYRWFMWCAWGLLTALLLVGVLKGACGERFAILWRGLALALLVSVVYFGGRLSTALRRRDGWVLLLALVLPPLVLPAAVILSRQATRWCHERGIACGLCGPDGATVARLRAAARSGGRSAAGADDGSGGAQPDCRAPDSPN